MVRWCDSACFWFVGDGRDLCKCESLKVQSRPWRYWFVSRVNGVVSMAAASAAVSLMVVARFCYRGSCFQVARRWSCALCIYLL